jgi:antitoxin HigA-1
MKIRSFVHKGLMRLYEDNMATGVPSDTVDKLRKMFFFLDAIATRGVSKMPMKSPPHPGDFIRTEIIEPAGLSVTAAAAALKVSRPALSTLLNGRADLSGDMALRIEQAFGVQMETLMRMQSAYDIAKTRGREKEIRGIRRLRLSA